MKTVYLSGPMSGMPDGNKHEFARHASILRCGGFRVVSPPELDEKKRPTDWRDAMRRDLRLLVACDYICMLPGWRKSRGAVLEKCIADELGIVEIGIDGKPRHDSILVEAESLINGDRQCQYGHPATDFVKTAKMWSGLFHNKLKAGECIEPEEVALAMILLKASRHSHKTKRDNIVDIAGYAGCLEMLMDWRSGGASAEQK